MLQTRRMPELQVIFENIKISNYVMKKDLVNQKLYRAGKIAGYMQRRKEENQRWIDELNKLEVDLIETTDIEYDKGWHDCNLKWDLRIEDLIRKIEL